MITVVCGYRQSYVWFDKWTQVMLSGVKKSKVTRRLQHASHLRLRLHQPIVAQHLNLYHPIDGVELDCG